MTTAKTYTKVEINTEKAIIYGKNGAATYFINDCGGIEINDIEGKITDDEIKEAQTEISQNQQQEINHEN